METNSWKTAPPIGVDVNSLGEQFNWLPSKDMAQPFFNLYAPNKIIVPPAPL